MFMNVMYGYTGAAHSGRMPSVDIADSVVETGRYILDQVISFINSHKVWKAEVVYGDTDSVFVHLKGRSIEEAFRIGEQMEKEISALYPYPMYLKFEKVYSSLILVSKKRYVGMKYEKPNDRPTMEGKGLEMQRRDGCNAIVRMMQKVVYEIFTTKNLSSVKRYMYYQW